MDASLIQQFAVILSVTSLLMFLTYLPNNKHIPGVKQWALALLLFPVAHWLFSAQESSLFWSVFIANLFLSTTLALIAIGTRNFYGLAKNNFAIGAYIYAALLTIYSYFTFYSPDVTMRQVLLSFLAISCFIIVIFSLVSAKHHSGKAKNWLLGLCIATSVLLFFRIYLKLNYNNQELQLEENLVYQSIELTMLLLGFFFAISFSLLCQERYTKYRCAIQLQQANDIKLKTLYMQTLKREVTAPIQGLIKENKTLPAAKQKAFSEYCQQLNNISQEVFAQAPKDEVEQQDSHDINYVKIEHWLNDMFASLQALANEKQITLSLNFIEPVSPSYLLDQYKLNLILVNLITQMISIKSSGVIELTIHISPSTSPRDAAHICFDFSEPHSGQEYANNTIDKSAFTRNFGSQFSQRIIQSLGNELNFYVDDDNTNHISFEISASEGLDDDIRYHIPRYDINPVSGLNILVVTDCHHTQQEIIEKLSQYNHSLDFSQDLLKMQKQLKEVKYNIVILDINASNFDALSVPNLLDKHCRNNHKVPVIALTSNVSAPAKVDLVKEGLTTLVAKPLQGNSLQRAINSLVKEHKIEKVATSLALQDEEIPPETLPIKEDEEKVQPAQELNPTEQGQSTSLPHFIQQRKEQRLEHDEVNDIVAQTSEVFNSDALALLIRDTNKHPLREVIKDANREINELLAQFKRLLKEHDQLALQQTLYKLAIASDRLGYTLLAEKLLTTEVSSIIDSGEAEFIRFEKLLLQSQTYLAEHMKTLS